MSLTIAIESRNEQENYYIYTYIRFSDSKRIRLRIHSMEYFNFQSIQMGWRNVHFQFPSFHSHFEYISMAELLIFIQVNII